MTDDEVSDVEAQGCRVLSRRHLESFLLADDALQAVDDTYEQPALGDQLIAARNQATTDAVANRSKSPDEMKAAAGGVYNTAKQLFN